MTDQDQSIEVGVSHAQDPIGNGEVTGLPVVQARTSAPVQLIQHAPVTLGDFVKGLAGEEALSEQKALADAYDNAVTSLISSNDVQEEGGRVFKKKSAWRKLARFFHLSTQEVYKSSGWVEGLNPMTGEKEVNFVAEVTMRAIAPWGQYMEATAACDTMELRFRTRGAQCPTCGGPMWDNRNAKEDWQRAQGDFSCKDKDCSGALQEGQYDAETVNKSLPNPVAFSKARHDCLATAQTRATNRSVSDLIAAGEVSWEEIQDGDQGAYRAPKGPSGQKSSPGGQQKEVDFLDQPASGKDNKGKNWRETCQDNPSFILWALGKTDGNPEGMRKLNVYQRTLLSDELDRLAEEGAKDQQDASAEGSQDQTTDQEQDQAHLKVLGEHTPTTGKFAKDTWLKIAGLDLPYLDKALDLSWGKKMLPEDSEIRAAVKWACGGGIERMRLEPTPESKETPSEAFVRLTNVEGVTMAQVNALAKVHPGLPDDFDAWKEEDYGLAVGAFQNASDKGGALYVLQRAEDSLKAKEESESPPEEVATIPAAMTKEADAVVEKAEAKGMDRIDWVKGMLLARSRGDVKAFEGQLDSLKQAYLAHVASGKGPAEAQGSIL